MTTPQVLMTKVRIASFLAKLKAHKEEARHCKDMEQPVATTIRYQRMAGREQRV